MKNYKVVILLSLCVLFWAGNFIFGSLVVTELTPVGLTFIRWLFASIILLIVAQKVEKPNWKQVLTQWPKILMLSLTGIIGYNLFLYYALYFTTPINASLVNSLNPGLIAIASAVYLRERISKYHIVGIFISLLGVFTVLTKGNLLQAFAISYNKGDILIIGAIIMWTVYSILGKKLSVPTITSTAVSGLMAAFILLPFVAASKIDYAGMSTLSLMGVIYIILFPSSISFVLWNIGVKEVGASKAGVFLNLNPVFTAIISGVMGQSISLVQLVGGLLVFIGVYITTATKGEQR